MGNTNIEEIKNKILNEFDWIYECIIDGDEIIIEEEYEMGEDEKNSDDCCDEARENGEMIIEKFPMLEISDYYCHRSKYAIVNLKIKKMSDRIKQVLVVRKDLKMRRGKEDSQCGHAALAFTWDTLLNGTKPRKEVIQWKEQGQTKITVWVNSEKELMEVFIGAKNLGLEAHFITDAGHTEFNGTPTKTVVAIGPNKESKINKITGGLPLR